jgi:hypothetical protein
MFEILHAYFESRFTLTKEDIALIKSVFIPGIIRKGEFLLREGDIAKYAGIIRGCTEIPLGCR